MDNEKMINNIRSICKENNITPTRLEEILGFSQGLISRWKDKTPSLDKIVDIADYFNVSLDEVVGRNIKQENNQNYIFVSNLINLTNNKTVTWMFYNYAYVPEGYYSISNIDCNIKDFNYYPDESRRIETYILNYKEAYVTLRCFLIINHKAIRQYDFSLFIQPQKNMEAVYQNCDVEQLLELYRCIERTLFGETPEMLADDFKYSINTETLPISNAKAEDIIKNPEIMQLMKTINTPEFKKLLKLFSEQGFQESIQTASKLQKFFDKFNGNK